MPSIGLWIFACITRAIVGLSSSITLCPSKCCSIPSRRAAPTMLTENEYSITRAAFSLGIINAFAATANATGYAPKAWPRLIASSYWPRILLSEKDRIQRKSCVPDLMDASLISYTSFIENITLSTSINLGRFDLAACLYAFPSAVQSAGPI